MRILVSSLLLLLLASPAHALGWGLGVNVVGSNNSLTGDLPDDGKWEGKTSVGGGLILDLDLARDITVSLQPTWIPRRSAQRIEKNGILLSVTEYDLEYLSFPLLVRVSSDPGRVRGFVTAGLTLAYLLEATAESGEESRDIGNDLDDFTIGALFGAGAIVEVWSQRLIFEFRYEQGLDDFVDRTQAPTALAVDTIPSVKYRELKFSAGFVFGPGGGQ